MGDYSKERIIFNIFSLRGAINRGMAIVQGNTVVCPLNYKGIFFKHCRPVIVLIVFRFIF